MTKNEQAKLNGLREMLIRIEERQRAIREVDLAGINKHLCDLNSSVLKNTIRSVQNERTNRMLVWVVGGIGALLGAIIGLIVFVN